MILWVFVISPPPIISGHICPYYLHPAPLERNKHSTKYHKKRRLPLCSDSLPGKKEIGASLPALIHPAIHICPQAEWSSPARPKQVHNTSSVTSVIPPSPLPRASAPSSHSSPCVISPPVLVPFTLQGELGSPTLLPSSLPIVYLLFSTSPAQSRAGSASSPCYISHSTCLFLSFCLVLPLTALSPHE